MSRPRSRIRYDLTAAMPLPRLTSRAVPTVDPWLAGEMFVSPHVEERRRGLAILIGTEAARRSPLTPQLLAARVDEPDLHLRAQIVRVLADYFEIRGQDYRYPSEVRAALLRHLRKFERPQIMALLELHKTAREGAIRMAAESLVRLFTRIPGASAHLTRAAGDRSLALALRDAAIDLVGRVGFIDALGALEGLEARLEGRRAGQLAMTFAPTDHPDELLLLPALKETLETLREAD